MPDARVRVGIVGLGYNGRQHAIAHAASAKSAVVALCDQDEHRLGAVGKELGVRNRCRDCADLLRWITGNDPTSVFSYSNHFAFPEFSSDDCMVSVFKFPDGAVAKVAALWAPECPRAPYYDLHLYGTRGTVERDQICLGREAPPSGLKFSPVDARRVPGHPYEPEVDDWLTAIIEDGEVRTSLKDGANSTMAALRAVRAAREGREVSIPVFG